MAIVSVVPANVRGKSEVAFDSHALQRMAERSITEAQVLATLQNPDITGLRADPGRLRVRRHYGSHHSIDVVFEEEPARIVVITVVRVVRK
jgi:hypothetical protein